MKAETLHLLATTHSQAVLVYSYHVKSLFTGKHASAVHRRALRELERTITDAVSRGKTLFLLSWESEFEYFAVQQINHWERKFPGIRIHILLRTPEECEKLAYIRPFVNGIDALFTEPGYCQNKQYLQFLVETVSEIICLIPNAVFPQTAAAKLAQKREIPITNLYTQIAGELKNDDFSQTWQEKLHCPEMQTLLERRMNIVENFDNAMNDGIPVLFFSLVAVDEQIFALLERTARSAKKQQGTP